MKGIISVIGKDKTGIIAKVSTALYRRYFTNNNARQFFHHGNGGRFVKG